MTLENEFLSSLRPPLVSGGEWEYGGLPKVSTLWVQTLRLSSWAQLVSLLVCLKR